MFLPVAQHQNSSRSHLSPLSFTIENCKQTDYGYLPAASHVTILQVDVQSNNIQAYPSYLKQRKHHNANLCWFKPCYSVLGKSSCRRKTQQLDAFVSHLCAQFGGMFPFIFPSRIRKNCNTHATKNTILIVVPILLLCHRIRLYASKRPKTIPQE